MRAVAPIIIECSVWLALAGSAFALTFKFDEPLQQYRYGASGWPRSIILTMALFALAQMVWRLRRFYRDEGAAQAKIGRERPPSKEPVTGLMVNLKRFGTFALPLAYLILMPRTGYYTITPLFIAGYMRLLGEHRWAHWVGTTLLIYGLTLVIFTKLLFVPLPVGNWPGFYEINSAFLALIK